MLNFPIKTVRNVKFETKVCGNSILHRCPRKQVSHGEIAVRQAQEIKSDQPLKLLSGQVVSNTFHHTTRLTCRTKIDTQQFL